MKIFVVAFVVAAAYCFVMIATANLALDQTQQFTKQYQSAVAQAESIADSSR